MAKRRASDDSDEDNNSLDASPASKRARTGEEPEPSAAPPTSARRAGKQARRNDANDDEDESGEVDIGDKDEDDTKFEEENAEAIRAAIEEKRKVHGGIAEHGIIEAIEMHQFMCHKYLTFTFGPQINFIIGHNGSGKSAVLSAITVALGGKANSTGRGNGLKSFIREGQSVAEVTISLKNQGEEAYKPNEYGKSIVITRRFTKEGASSWKIKSKDGRVISTKKDELAAICDHMNIQVDNPMNVLTQDAARQFLSASHPADKYKFFLRGTQLSQLSDEYVACLDNISQTSSVLQQKREALPDLRAAHKEAQSRWEEADKAREQKKKADELKKELAWAHVAAKEAEMTAKFQEAAKMARRLPKIQESIDTAKAQFETTTEEVTRHEAELAELGDIEHLNARKDELREEMRKNKMKLNDYVNDERQMNTSLKAVNTQIQQYEKSIIEETRRMEASTQAKREETNRRLEEMREKIAALNEKLKNINEEQRIKRAEADAHKDAGIAAENAMNELQGQIMRSQDMIKRCIEQEKNSLSAYGNDIKTVLDRIQQTRWHGEIPLGPLGVHVKVREPERWANLLRAQLAQYLMAFACTDARDRPILKKLLEQTGNRGTLIIIFEKDLFDYSAGEPPENYLTVLRALEITDPHVLRILINQARIERMFLATTRPESEQILRSLRGGGTAWTADGFKVTNFAEGGGSSTKLSKLAPNSGAHLLFTGRNAAEDIERYRAQIAADEEQLKIAREKMHGFRRLYDAARRAADQAATQERLTHEELRRMKVAHATLQEEVNNDLPAGIAGFEDAKKEAEEEKANIMIQFEDLIRAKREIEEKQTPLLHALNDVKAQIDAFEDKRRAIGVIVEEAVVRRLKAQTDITYHEKKLKEEQIKVKEVEDAAAILQEEFTSWTTKAEDYCDRFPNPRKVEDIQRNLESVNRALREREKKQGKSVEELEIEVRKTQANLENVERDLRSMSNLMKALKSSLTIRLSRWQEFRRHIALRCKLVFQYHLSHRGYYGKVLFDHQAGTLQLKVQTDDQTSTQSRDKDPRSLSGGEKSFSTICLLLSLWESIGCPLRCLDEFDVFMDAVNRRISMKMMIDTANSSDKKQYILITPQDMNNVAIGTTVRVHRMTDPERGQGVLAFS